MDFLWSYAYGHPDWPFKGKNYCYELRTCHATLLTYFTLFSISQKHCTLGRGRSKTWAVSTRGQIAGEMETVKLRYYFKDDFQGYSPWIRDSAYICIPVYMCVKMYVHLPTNTAGGQSTTSGIIPQKPSTSIRFLGKV